MLLKPPKKTLSAFTLIETLIAVSVIALIIAIAIPALNKTRADARRTQAEAISKTLNEAIIRARIKDKTDDGISISRMPPELASEDMYTIIEYLYLKGYIQ